MRSLFTPRSWYYRFGFDMSVDFCFWVLERDGLSVPPFDHHPEGDGSLRAARLDARSWRVWLERTIAAGEEKREIINASTIQKGDFKRLRELEPEALWDGELDVGQRLATLAEAYAEISNMRAEVKIDLDRIHYQCERERRLWKELSPYRQTLPPVQIVAFGYPGPVQDIVAPDTILLAVGNWRPTPSELADAILEGMRALAEVA